MPRNRISVDAAVLTAIVEDIQEAFDHQCQWGPSVLMSTAAKRAQDQLIEILTNAGHQPRGRR